MKKTKSTYEAVVAGEVFTVTFTAQHVDDLTRGQLHDLRVAVMAYATDYLVELHDGEGAAS